MKKNLLWSITCIFLMFIVSIVFVAVPLLSKYHTTKVHAAENSSIIFPENPYDGCYYTTQCAFGGAWFAPSEKVRLYVDYGTAGKLDIATATTDTNGSFQVSIKTPSDPYNGTTQLVAVGLSSKLRASTPLEESPAFFSSIEAGTVGTTVKVKGGDFGSSEVVNITFGNNLIKTVNSDVRGAFATSFIIPKGTVIGGQEIDATGATSGARAFVTISVIPGERISPDTGSSSTQIVVTGKNLIPSIPVSISWYDSTTDTYTYIVTVNANQQGTFSTTITAPSNLLAGTTYYINIDTSEGGNQAAFYAI